ncbi:MAG: PAS domain-containing protein, partial [Pontibacter sp.]|nr:PAS domain-containing protein [Pontibacter sp.]
MKLSTTPPPQLLQAYEQVPDLYLILSPQLFILTASDAYLAATYTIREEIVGRQLFDVFPDNPAAKGANRVNNLRHSLQQVLDTKRPHRMALQHYDVPHQAQPSGFAEKYWLPLNTPVLDEQGQVQYIIHKVEDVTERRKAEHELKQSRELLQITVDSSLDMIQVFEAVRDESGEIIDFKWILNNKTSETIYGDVVGKSLLENNPGVIRTGIFD